MDLTLTAVLKRFHKQRAVDIPHTPRNYRARFPKVTHWTKPATTFVTRSRFWLRPIVRERVTPRRIQIRFVSPLLFLRVKYPSKFLRQLLPERAQSS